jgi:hypothetical protein
MGKFVFVTMIIFGLIANGCAGISKDNAIEKFKNNGDGTVTDLSTGLIWQQSDVKKDWEEANSYCDELDYANRQDWRLPSYEELQAIVDNTKSNVMIDILAFPGTKPSLYWSATEYESYYIMAYAVDFINGNLLSEEKAFANFVRCVRQEQ